LEGCPYVLFILPIPSKSSNSSLLIGVLLIARFLLKVSWVKVTPFVHNNLARAVLSKKNPLAFARVIIGDKSRLSIVPPIYMELSPSGFKYKSNS
jgi:hypothetical protein